MNRQGKFFGIVGIVFLLSLFGYYFLNQQNNIQEIPMILDKNLYEENQNIDSKEDLHCKKLAAVESIEKEIVLKNEDDKESYQPDALIKRRKFVSNKLWRDDAPAKLVIEDGAIVHVKTLTDEEYVVELGLKLLEEAAEVQTAVDKHELISEIGDVYEVLDCIIAYHNLSKDAIKKAQDKKREARGSYLKRQYVTYAEYLPDGFMVPYCLKQPDKYQEIFD